MRLVKYIRKEARNNFRKKEQEPQTFAKNNDLEWYPNPNNTIDMLVSDTSIEFSLKIK